jgi:hypothetical protein
MFLKIVSPCGKDLGSTPINAAVRLCDGSYGLIEFLGDDLAKVAEIEGGIVDLIRDACEPISEDDFNPQAGLRVEFMGFVGEVVA